MSLARHGSLRRVLAVAAAEPLGAAAEPLGGAS